MKPIISVIVPVYNVAEYLDECLTSVIEQALVNYEIIVVNDGSTDGSGGICNKYAIKYPHLLKVIHQKNKGLGGARNTGIMHASGEYLLFVDSDDYIEPNTIIKLTEKIKEFKSDIVIFGSYSFRNPNDRVIFINESTIPKEKVFTLTTNPSIINIQPSAWNKLVKKKLFINNSIKFPENVWYEDIRTITKLYPHAQSIVLIGDILYNYRLRPGSIMNNANIVRNNEIIDAFKDIITYYNNIGKFETYKNEIELLTIRHLYIFATVRVLRLSANNKLIKELRNFLVKAFPRYSYNLYLRYLPNNEKWAYKLLEYRMYVLLYYLFKIKSHL